MKIRLTEQQLNTIIKESVRRILLSESHSHILYHFLNFYAFDQMVETNSFTPSDAEKDWHNGQNTMSFSRTKSFKEGWPIIMYSADDGKGDDWCAIRLTIDAEKLQANHKVKPFDWAYKDNDDGDPSSFADNYYGISAHNGKEWMMDSDEYTYGYLPIDYGKGNFVNSISDKQGHPYSQAEDRLVTNKKSIPNALGYITRIDILLLPHFFNTRNKEDRTRLAQILNLPQIKQKAHAYTKMKDLETETNELPQPYLTRLLNRNSSNNYKDPIPHQLGTNVIKRDF